MLYTKKGDNGTTKLFNSRQGERLSKNALVFEALGVIDELNCTIGYAKVLSSKAPDTLCINGAKVSYENILEKIQSTLFLLQAELSGAGKHIKESEVAYLENVIFEVETVLPPINSFIIPGGGETGAYLDIGRTVTRRAERTIVSLGKEKNYVILSNTYRFLNRLSSALYALARFANYQEGYTERNPRYD